MNKKLQILTKPQAFTEFTTKLADKWNLRTLPNTSTEPAGDKTAKDFLRDLVAMPTVTGNYDAIHDAFNYIEKYLHSLNLFVERHEWNGVESLVASPQKTRTPTVCLFGHVDVVPAPEKLFQLQEHDGNYYGRGVVDMKLGLAAYLAALKNLQQNLSDYDFCIMITSDEEVGGFDGAAKLVEEGYRPKIMVLPDGGTNWNMERFAKGIWHLTIEATGVAAHGSRPWEGENAIDKLMTILSEIRGLFPKQMKPETSTINVGIIQGGEAINQIPAVASASVDMRFSSAAEQKRIIRKIVDLIDRAPGVTSTTEVEASPMVNDPENFYLKEYAACTEEVIGRPTEWVISNAGNDGRFFSDLGIPCAIAYPPGGNHHGAAEFTPQESLPQMQAIVMKYLERVALTK